MSPNVRKAQEPSISELRVVEAISPFREVSPEEAAKALASSGRKVVVTKKALIWEAIRSLPPKGGVEVAAAFISYKKLQSVLPQINRAVAEAKGKEHYVVRQLEGKLYIIRDR